MANCKNSDDSITNIENLKNLNYLTFKGGGGKGIVYLGPIDVLSHNKVGLLPVRLPVRNNVPGLGQGIIGISGTSAGAITAYLSALGLTANEIRNESGLIPPRKNPFYDPNYDPNFPPFDDGFQSEYEDTAGSFYPGDEFWPGDNTSGFNFEHFITKDAPEVGYKRAVVYDKASGRNKVIRCVDAVIPKAKKGDNKKIANHEREQAIAFGFDVRSVNNVHATLTKKELKKLRSAKVHPAVFTGTAQDPNLQSAAKEVFKENRARLQIFGSALDVLVDKSEMANSRSAIVRKIFENSNSKLERVLSNVHLIGNIDEFILKQFQLPGHWLYIYNILYDQGLFPGFAVQDYFADVTSRRLPVVLRWSEAERKEFTKEKALEMTFAEFHEYTGLDLVIAGLNVVNGNQRNFSYRCTPDFPVVAAVMMSMNIPGLFKPVYVDAEINKSLGEKESKRLRAEYRGFYVDAGLANNFPMHAFDDDVKGTEFFENKGYNELILGLAVQEGPDPEVFKNYAARKAPDPYFQTFKEHNGQYLYKKYANNIMTHATDPDYLPENFFHLLGDLYADGTADTKQLQELLHKLSAYNGIPTINGGMLQMTLPPMLGWILNSVLINTTISQTKEEGFHSRVLDVYSYHIGITDFKADPNLTEFVVKRAREKTIRDLKLDIDPNKEF